MHEYQQAAMAAVKRLKPKVLLFYWRISFFSVAVSHSVCLSLLELLEPVVLCRAPWMSQQDSTESQTPLAVIFD